MKSSSWSMQFGMLFVASFFLSGPLSGSARCEEEAKSAFADAIRIRLEETQSVPPETLQAMTDFYEARSYSPLWIGGHGFNHAGVAVVGTLRRADDWGLKTSDFDIPNPASGESPVESLEGLADAEIRLSLAVLKYADNARGGRIPNPDKQLSSYLDRHPQLLPPSEVLTQIGNSPRPASYLEDLNPQQEQFQKLRKVYLDLRVEAGRIEAAHVPASGKLLYPGRSDPDVAIVRKRLGLSEVAGQENVYDDALVGAVRRFQKQRGLRSDGLIGSRTRRELNSGPNKEIDAVLANMEQWRWMPADLGREYVLVNIPSFQVDLVRDGQTLFSERIVVGKSDTQTPIFSGDMQTVVLHPKWHIPESIKLKEVLPSLLRGRSLESMGFRLMRGGREVDSRRIDWNRVDIRKYEIYQAAGDDNALGQVKFLFPNKHAVYLHDTPSKRLFKSMTRTFSHGCVRVRNPMKFAQLLLDGDKGWEPARVAGLMENGPFDNAITLDRPVPVHLSYFTVWVGDDGSPHFMPDVYGHQKRISLALAGRWDDIDKGKDHLAPVEMVRIEQRPRKSRGRVASGERRRSRPSVAWSAPMGLFNDSGSRSGRSYGSTADDIFRRSFGN